MKQIYLSIAICLFASATCFGQILYGVQGSFQSANIGISAPAGAALGGFDFTSMIKAKMGFRVGVMADIPITDQLSIRPQLLYSTKGYKLDPREFISALSGTFGGPPITASSLPDSLVQSVRISYLELPIQAMYGFDAGPGRAVIGAGPYIAYALNGAVNGQSTPFGSGAKRFDYGANLSLGYELPGGLTFSAYYSRGFANQASADDGNTPPDPNSPPNPTASGTATNRAFGLTLGYFFGTGN